MTKARLGNVTARAPPKTSEVRDYFESDATVVSSPLTVFGNLTPYGREFLERFAAYFRGRRVLDAGAGLGIVSTELALQYDAFVVALDYSRWVTSINRSAHPVQADMMSLPFADGSFDSAVCMEVLEHTLNPVQGVAELWRVLRPGGSLIMSTPSYANVAGALKIILEGLGIYDQDTFAPFDGWKPKVLERRLTAFSVSRMLQRQGFRVRHVEGAELFDAMAPFANKIPGLFQNERFLRVREFVDRWSSWPLVKWLTLHGIFLADRL
jgi:ubiquinone/menaquinone biosynthesis C-methylase UbiE